MKLLCLLFTNLFAFLLITRVRRAIALTLIGAVALTMAGSIQNSSHRARSNSSRSRQIVPFLWNSSTGLSRTN